MRARIDETVLCARDLVKLFNIFCWIVLFLELFGEAQNGLLTLQFQFSAINL